MPIGNTVPIGIYHSTRGKGFPTMASSSPDRQKRPRKSRKPPTSHTLLNDLATLRLILCSSILQLEGLVDIAKEGEQLLNAMLQQLSDDTTTS
jgi:hypothetical protein